MRNIFVVLLIGVMLSVTGCGGGGSSSSSESTVQKPRKEKAYREPLKASDIATEYSPSAKSDSFVTNVFGTLSYRLADGEPEDIVSVDQYTGLLTILNAGDVRILVEDTSPEYQTSSATYTVHVEKGTNYELSATTTTISTLEQEDTFIVVRGNQGTLTFEVAPESSAIVDIDSLTGELTPRGVPGRARIIVTDSGNRQYHPKSYEVDVFVKAVNTGDLVYGDLSREFSEGLVLTPQRVNRDEDGSYYFELAQGYEESDVLTLDPLTGQMQIHNAGSVKIKVTNELGSSYEKYSRIAYFDVEVKRAERPELFVSKASSVYSPNHIVEPALNNIQGKVTYRVVSGDDVIIIDPVSQLPKIIGVGTATLTAYDDGNGNYRESQTSFEFEVQKAPHPGLASLTITRSFTDNEQLRSLTPVLEGQKGQLTFSGTTDVVSYRNSLMTIEHAGVATLTATDDGGKYYQPSSATLTVKVEKGDHPAFSVSDIAKTYSPGLCVPLSEAEISGNKGSLAITSRGGNTSPVATYDEGNRCFQIYKHGSAVFDVVSNGDNDYLASSPKALSVVITAAGSSISVEDGIEATFEEGQPTIAPPAVVGQKGVLTYRIDLDTAIYDVVQVNSDTGEMTVLNAGTTLVEVTDSGADGYQTASVTYSVKITKADNPISVTLPEVAYEPGKHFIPVVSDSKGKLRFYVPNEYYGPVKRVDALTGELEIKSAGDYQLQVTAEESRNYLAGKLVVNGSISKAPHPGIKAEPESFAYVPMKDVTLQLPAAMGKRSYSVESSNGRDKKAFASIDPNKGNLTLLDYDPRGSDVLLDVNITEEESRNYLALLPSYTPAKQVSITQPKAGQSDKDITLLPLFTILDSAINNNISYRNLQSTQVNFAGVYGALQPTDDELRDWGEGVTLLLMMKPVGSDNPLERKGITVYAQRYVGCSASVNILNLSEATPRKMDSSNYCWSGQTNRIMTFRVIDRETLGPGDWETLVPFVVYQSSDTPFSASESGGAYVTNGGFHPGGSEPTQMIEWNRVELKISNL